LGKRERFSKVSWAQLRFLDYIKHFLYLSVIMTILVQQEVNGI